MTRPTPVCGPKLVAFRVVNPLRRSLLLFAAVALVAAACGQTRTPSDDAISAPDSAPAEAVDGGHGDTPEVPAIADPVVEITDRNDSTPVATITFPNGDVKEITGERYAEIIDSVTGSERFVGNIYQGSFGQSDEGFILGQLILGEFFEYAAADRGLTVDQTVVAARRSELIGDLEQGMLTEPDPAGAAAEVGVEIAPYVDSLSRLIAAQEGVSEDLAAGVEGTEVLTYCTRHILVETEAEADDLMAQLADGADFEVLAAEFSTDTGSGAQGGDLGCNEPEVFVPPFSEAMVAADIDEVVGPVQSDFGFHIIQVYEQRNEVIPPDTSALMEDLMSGLAADSTVEIDPLIGKWDPNSFSVIAPG